ncbi:MAG: YlbF family regulator [Planctomycetes bacterium]|nr:YlbF family regulator [Planctomycetota bacterium]
MDDVLAQARKLADLISGHARTQALRDAVAAVEADAEAKRVQSDYAHAVETVREREMTGKPVEPDQKRALVAAAEAVRRSPVLLRMLQANADYVEMMEAVQATLSGGSDHEHGPGCDHDHGHGHAHDHGHAPAAPEKPREDDPPQRSSILWTP